MKKSKFFCSVTISLIVSATMATGCASSTNKVETSGTGSKPAKMTEPAKVTETDGETTESEQKEVTLQYSTTSTPGTVYVQAFQKMADEVEEKTGGKIHVVVYDSNQLGGENDTDTNILDESIDMCNTGSGELGKRYPAFSVFRAPYLFGGYEHFEKSIGGDAKANLFKQANEHLGAIVCGTQTMGARYVITTGLRAATPAEFVEARIRRPDMPPIVAVVNGLGMAATPMTTTEQYLTMRQGVVDGAEHTLSGFSTWNIQELYKELILTNHTRGITFTLISQSCLDGLAQENQQILSDAIHHTASWANEQTNREEEKFMKCYQEENRIELVEVDDNTFREALTPVAEKLSADDPKLYSEVQDLAQQKEYFNWVKEHYYGKIS